MEKTATKSGYTAYCWVCGAGVWVGVLRAAPSGDSILHISLSRVTRVRYYARTRLKQIRCPVKVDHRVRQAMRPPTQSFGTSAQWARAALAKVSDRGERATLGTSREMRQSSRCLKRGLMKTRVDDDAAGHGTPFDGAPFYAPPNVPIIRSPVVSPAASICHTAPFFFSRFPSIERTVDNLGLPCQCILAYPAHFTCILVRSKESCLVCCLSERHDEGYMYEYEFTKI